MAKTTLLSAVGLVLVSCTSAAPESGRARERADGMRFLPDVPGQFYALTERPDALGLHIGSTPNPSACRHYQGIVRVDGADGTPFFLVTRSGNTPDLPGPADELLCDDSPGEKRNGNLVVFRMGSRDKLGERLRSNRLRKGTHVNSTVPPAEDTATIFFTVAEGGLVLGGDDDPLTPKVYQHPGGMQVVGHMMVMASEAARPYPNGCGACLVVPDPPPQCDPCFNYDRASSPTLIMFFDVSDPEDPTFTSQFAPFDQDGDALQGCDGIALTPLPGGLYLMAATGGFEPHDPIYFYRSRPLGDCDDPNVDCTLANPALAWDFVGQATDPNSGDDAHQSLHFLREGDLHGDLYLAGARGHAEIGPFFEDRDRIDLYHVDCDTEDCAPGETVSLTVRYNSKRITPRPSSGGDLLASLAAATGFYETPSGELLFYATEHDNDGPSGTLRAGEWRHQEVVREGSPTLLPTARVNGPYEVDEGSMVNLTGSALPPITKAWVQLYHDLDYGSYYPVVDFDDYELDDFDDLFAFEYQIDLLALPPVLFFHGDQARSLKWFAPAGCSILLTDHDGDDVDETLTLAGSGSLGRIPDLTQVSNDGGTDDVDQEIDAVAFLDGCGQYYAQPIDLQWDLDGDGSYETTGSGVTFDAGALDGPDVVDLSVRAQPATGTPGEAIATVVIRNVAPVLSPVRLTDGAGNEVNVEVPFVLTGLPVTASATFTDPGLPDHQTAQLDWGDGALDLDGAFTLFDEAFGDGTGEVRHSHVYALAGTFAVALAVTDDDGGSGEGAAAVEVLTPEQAVGGLVEMLDDLIAGTTDPQLRGLLEKARRALAGNPNGLNGALNKIEAGQTAAAIAFLQQAIKWLTDVASEVPEVATLIALLEQVIAALGAGP